MQGCLEGATQSPFGVTPPKGIISGTYCGGWPRQHRHWPACLEQPTMTSTSLIPLRKAKRSPGAFTQRPSSAHRRRDCMACHGTTWTAGDACRDRDKSLWGHPTQWYQNWYTLHCSSFNRLGSRCLCCLGQPCAAVIPSLVPLRRPERSQGASAEHATNGLRHIAVYSLP